MNGLRLSSNNSPGVYFKILAANLAFIKDSCLLETGLYAITERMEMANGLQKKNTR